MVGPRAIDYHPIIHIPCLYPILRDYSNISLHSRRYLFQQTKIKAQLHVNQGLTTFRSDGVAVCILTAVLLLPTLAIIHQMHRAVSLSDGMSGDEEEGDDEDKNIERHLESKNALLLL
jgi:hypothetical protein